MTEHNKIETFVIMSKENEQERYNIFLKQVVMQRGIPFDVKLPAAKPVEAGTLTEAEMNQELEKGYTDFVQGKTKPAAQAFAQIRKDYGL